MKKGILLAVYVVIAAAIIGVGAWYANTLTQPQATATTNSTTTNAPAPQPTVAGQSITTMDGLVIKDDVIGTGAVAQVGQTVTVNYTGTLDDGTVFDSSLKPGRTPFSFVLGAGQVIKGWDEGVLGMKIGGTRELTIPPTLGYGAQGAGSVIPPNATLHFTVTLLSVSTSSGQ
jgi:peptidylprolyl isomerase/FKBP-type peptidyl-prolyl cis-trans isomerase FkpA